MNLSSKVPPPIDLVAVTIVTKLEETYLFPDMARGEIERVIVEDWAIPSGTLTLVNVSQACLVIPIRIIRTIKINDEVKWSSP